jgi:peptidoglycan hydrolase CwlO-like protein
LILSFNDKTAKLKEKCDELKRKMNIREMQECEAEKQLGSLKKVIAEKNEVIAELRARAEAERRKEGVGMRRSRTKKRNYFISDGEKEHGEVEMSELEN